MNAQHKSNDGEDAKRTFLGKPILRDAESGIAYINGDWKSHRVYKFAKNAFCMPRVGMKKTTGLIASVINPQIFIGLSIEVPNEEIRVEWMSWLETLDETDGLAYVVIPGVAQLLFVPRGLDSSWEVQLDVTGAAILRRRLQLCLCATNNPGEPVTSAFLGSIL